MQAKSGRVEFFLETLLGASVRVRVLSDQVISVPGVHGAQYDLSRGGQSVHGCVHTGVKD
jgi:hypothetical protein